MVAPAFVAVTQANAFSASPTVNIPVGASVGDRAVLVITGLIGEGVVTPPAGWTPLENSGVRTGSNGAMYIYTAEVGATGDVDPGDPATMVIEGSTGWTASVTVYGASDVDAFVSRMTGATDPTDTSPASTASADARVVHIYGTITSPAGTQITIDSHASTVARAQQCTNATGQRNAVHLVADEAVVAGPVAGRTVTSTDISDPPTGELEWQTQAATLVLTQHVNRPTVEAGANQTIVTNGDFGVTGVVTGDGGGAGAPYTPTWRIVSDTTGGAILDATNALSVTGTAGPNAGSIVLGFKVADIGAVESIEDTLTINVIGATDIARPIGDVDVAGWTPSTGATVWEVISDNNDTTWATSPLNPVAEALRNDLLPLNTPGPDDPVTFAVRVRRANASTATVDFAIIEGTSTLIAQSTGNVIPAGSTFVEFSMTLSPAQKAAVANWGDLDSVITVSASE